MRRLLGSALAALLLLPCLTHGSVSEVRICALLPKTRHNENRTTLSKGHVRLAVLQAALSEINGLNDLLPHTTIRMVHGDSRCNQLTALDETTEMIRHGFGGAGCHLIIGAACSSASKGVATVATLVGLPQISYSSTSPMLSDSDAFPTFARVAVSDTLQSSALAGIVRHLLGYTRVATLSSTDAYGAGGIAAFHEAATIEEFDVLARATFAPGVSEADLLLPSGPLDQIRRSGARVVCLTHSLTPVFATVCLPTAPLTEQHSSLS